MDSPGKNTGVGCYALLQRIFPTQGLNPGFPHCKWIPYLLSHQGSRMRLIYTLSDQSEKAMAPHSSTLAWKNTLDRGAWWAAVHGVAKSWTQLSNFTFTFHFHALEKEMATHSSVLAWRIPGTGEPGGLSSMGSHRVRHD